MRRKISDYLVDWKNRGEHKVLLVKGCRQIGKTYSVLEFAKSNYSQYIYVNFEKEPDFKLLFENALDADTILDRLQLKLATTIDVGNCLLFLDEIGYCDKAYSSLKWFNGDKRVDVIASGSLLGVLLNNRDDANTPMGSVTVYDMHPLDFEEFLWAMGISQKYIDEVRGCINTHKALDDYVSHSFDDLFRRYIVVGGMPEAVLNYSKNKNYHETRKIQEEILSFLKQDVSKYSSKPDRLKILRCMDSIPAQLSKENNTFQYSDISKENPAGRKYSSALLWLDSAGVIKQSNNLQEPVIPLSSRERSDSFKIFMSDTGLLLASMDYSDAYSVVVRDYKANIGGVMENAVACAIISRDIKLRYFRNSKSTMELDFILMDDGKVTAFEVKSGRKKRSTSINSFIKTYKGSIGIKLAEGNILTDENGILHLPLYAPWFMEFKAKEMPGMDYLENLSEQT